MDKGKRVAPDPHGAVTVTNSQQGLIPADTYTSHWCYYKGTQPTLLQSLRKVILYALTNAVIKHLFYNNRQCNYLKKLH